MQESVGLGSKKRVLYSPTETNGFGHRWNQRTNQVLEEKSSGNGRIALDTQKTGGCLHTVNATVGRAGTETLTKVAPTTIPSRYY